MVVLVEILLTAMIIDKDDDNKDRMIPMSVMVTTMSLFRVYKWDP